MFESSVRVRRTLSLKLRHNRSEWPGGKMTESFEQRQLIQWCRTQPWGQYLFHIPNESIGGQGWIVRNRQMGCRKGVPDLMLPIPMKGFHGLFIEMKTQTGRQSEDQKRWQSVLNTFGYKAVVCKGWEEAKNVLEEYMT